MLSKDSVVIDFLEYKLQSGDEFVQNLEFEIFPSDKFDVFFESYNVLQEGREYISKSNTYFYVKNDAFIQDNNIKFENSINSKIEKIRFYFNEVNSGIKEGKYSKNTLSDETKNTDYELHTGDIFFKLLKKTSNSKNSIIETDYYFLGNKIFFIYYIEKDSSTFEIMSENRFYLSDNKLIKVLQGKSKMDLSKPEIEAFSGFLKQELAEAKAIVKKFGFSIE